MKLDEDSGILIPALIAHYYILALNGLKTAGRIEGRHEFDTLNGFYKKKTRDLSTFVVFYH